MSATIALRPMHETAKNLVSVPTVVDHTLVCGERKLRSAFIQWFGQCDGPNELPNEQFFFDTCVKPDDPMWQGKMETFRVIFLGPIKRWPSPEHIRALMQMAKGDEDTNIVWMLSPLPMVVDPGKPTSPSMPIVLLGDPNYGAIKPRFYCDMSVRDRVMAEFEANLPLAEKLLRDPGMELPPEEIPWEDNPRSCSDCERFGHSDSAPRTDDLAYICPYCHRRWWQFNDYYHLWKHVTSREEWDEIRRQQILKDAGYGFPDQ